MERGTDETIVESMIQRQRDKKEALEQPACFKAVPCGADPGGTRDLISIALRASSCSGVVRQYQRPVKVVDAT